MLKTLVLKLQMEADVVLRDFRRVLVSDKLTFIVLYFLTLKRKELAVGEVNILFISIRKMAFIIVLKKRGVLFLLQYYNIVSCLNPRIF